MIGLVLVTHGRLAVEFRSALEHVVGPQRQIEAVTIGPDDDVDQRRKDIIEAVKRVAHIDRSACRRCFEERFTVARMASEYARLYRDISGERRLVSAV